MAYTLTLPTMSGTLMPQPWAVGGPNLGSVRAITVGSAGGGNASLADGFPAVTMANPAGGGVAPAGADFNGIFQWITSFQTWVNAGQMFPYSATLLTGLTGGTYPQGTVLMSTGYNQIYLATAATAVNPDTLTAAQLLAGLSGWVVSGGNMSNTGANTGAGIIGWASTNAYPGGSVGAILNSLNTSVVAISATTGASNTGAGSVGWNATNSYPAGTVGGVLNNLAGNIVTPGVRVGLVGYTNGSSDQSNWTVSSLTAVSASGVGVTGMSLSLVNHLTSGVGLDGLETGGSLAYSAWFYIWAISNGTTWHTVASTSSSSPNLSGGAFTGYIYRARISSIRTQGTTSYFPLSMSQYDRKIQWQVQNTGNMLTFPIMASGTTAGVSLPLGAFVPPTAAEISLSLGTYANTNANLFICENSNASSAIAYIQNANTNGQLVNTNIVLTSAQSLWWTGANNGGQIFAIGYTDNL